MTQFLLRPVTGRLLARGGDSRANAALPLTWTNPTETSSNKGTLEANVDQVSAVETDTSFDGARPDLSEEYEFTEVPWLVFRFRREKGNSG